MHAFEKHREPGGNPGSYSREGYEIVGDLSAVPARDGTGQRVNWLISYADLAVDQVRTWQVGKGGAGLFKS